MNTPPPFSSSARYPAELKNAEQTEIASRRALNGIDPSTPLVGVALSGGGIRSATFCLGLFQALARQHLIRRIDFLSTVSGGGYFGSFLGAAFAREDTSADKIEAELANNRSWPVNWLRENGRFLSPNGAGDNWLAAAVALRNWAALQTVLLTFGLFVFGLAALIRTDLCVSHSSRPYWLPIEDFFWNHPAVSIWWSPWMVLPLIPFVGLMVPTGTYYWLTQMPSLMAVQRRIAGLFVARFRAMNDSEFVARVQGALTRGFMVGLAATLTLTAFATLDSLGQTVYFRWSLNDFGFPAIWTMITGAGTLAFGFGAKAALYLERLLGLKKFRLPFEVVALILASIWLFTLMLALSVAAAGFAWEWKPVWQDQAFQPMSGSWALMLTVAICFVASWFFSRSFGFVNLSSMQQIYAARLSRAYIGATNPGRRQHKNFDMTELLPGDEIGLDDYAPQRRGGPLHLINVTLNETLSGKTQIERRDRKGLPMAVGPCGLSVGHDSHARWISETPLTKFHALWEARQRAIEPIDCNGDRFHALCDNAAKRKSRQQRIEALALGRWTAISGAAFTTGTGATTSLGLSLLLGLANVRLGYWWNSGIVPDRREAKTRSNFLELGSRILSRILPVQTCLLTEFFARFHGPARQHWYLSDGGHFENTACYELIRRRVPFIICSDAGQDPKYQFADFANLVRKVRTDFGAEIQVVRRKADLATDDPGARFPMPKLEDIVHPALLDVIGVPEDFRPLDEDDAAQGPRTCCSERHAVLARIHYTDNDEFSWLLLIKPSVMGDETADVTQYQRTHPLFPQEPTTDQYFDEAQWESYRKLGEHIGTELFTPPSVMHKNAASWSPSQMCPPTPTGSPPTPARFAMAV